MWLFKMKERKHLWTEVGNVSCIVQVFILYLTRFTLYIHVLYLCFSTLLDFKEQLQYTMYSNPLKAIFEQLAKSICTFFSTVFFVFYRMSESEARFSLNHLVSLWCHKPFSGCSKEVRLLWWYDRQLLKMYIVSRFQKIHLVGFMHTVCMWKIWWHKFSLAWKVSRPSSRVADCSQLALWKCFSVWHVVYPFTTT